jgi:hypothetical protein
MGSEQKSNRSWISAKHDDETAKALLQVEAAVNKSGNKDAAENFESFSGVLSKPEPKKSLLKTPWQGACAFRASSPKISALRA